MPPPAQIIAKCAAALVFLVVLAYLPIWTAGYLWDDDILLTANPVIIGPDGFLDMWTAPAADICPLTLSTLWVWHAIWGLNPLPYHLLTLAFHAAAAVVLWRVLVALRVPGAWIGAALWALHPVIVASVAWISEIKNTESAFFALLAVLFFIRSLRTEKPIALDIAFTLLFTALAMAAKTSTIILPAVFGLCAWWLRVPNLRRIIIPVTGAALLAIPAILLSLATQHSDNSAQPFAERLIIVGDAIWFYVGKLIAPVNLMMIYPRWQPQPSALAYLPLVAVFALTTALIYIRTAWTHAGLFAWLIFLTALAPVVGLVDMSYSRISFVADHLQYLAAIGPLALAGSAISLLPPARVAVATVLLAICIAATAWRATFFHDEITLWTENITKNPGCWLGFNNRGVARAATASLDDAMEDFGHALALNPNYAQAHNNLGNAYLVSGNTDAAEDEFDQALRLMPNDLKTLNNRSAILVRKGDYQAAIDLYKRALHLEPHDAETHNNLGLVYAQAGRFEAAHAEFAYAVRLRPDFQQARDNLAHAQAALDQESGR